MSLHGLESVKELFEMKAAHSISNPFILLSHEPIRKIEQSYNINLEDVKVYPLLTSKTIGEIYTTAINYKNSKKIWVGRNNFV